MGFNILGVTLNKIFEDKIELCKSIGIGNVNLIDKNSFFEDSISSYSMEDNDVFITETEGGTLITFGTDVDFLKLKINHLTENSKGLQFVIGETIGMYMFLFAENGINKRYYFFADGNIVSDKGNKLDLEKFGDTSNLIFNLISETLGTSFWTIEPDCPSYRYKIR